MKLKITRIDLNKTEYITIFRRFLCVDVKRAFVKVLDKFSTQIL